LLQLLLVMVAMITIMVVVARVVMVMALLRVGRRVVAALTRTYHLLVVGRLLRSRTQGPIPINFIF
jgi:hypothetical protein